MSIARWSTTGRAGAVGRRGAVSREDRFDTKQQRRPSTPSDAAASRRRLRQQTPPAFALPASGHPPCRRAHCSDGRGPLVSPRAADGCIVPMIRTPVRATPTSSAALLLPQGVGLLLRARKTNARTTATRPCPGTIACITAASSCRLSLCHACDRELGGQGEACLAGEAVFAVLSRPGAWIGQPSTTVSRGVLPMLRSHSASPSTRCRGARPAGGLTTAAAVREAPPSFGGRLHLGYSRFHDGHPSPSQNREWRLCGREGPSIRSWPSRSQSDDDRHGTAV
jgi:hypothetical protein